MAGTPVATRPGLIWHGRTDVASIDPRAAKGVVSPSTQSGRCRGGSDAFLGFMSRGTRTLACRAASSVLPPHGASVAVAAGESAYRFIVPRRTATWVGWDSYRYVEIARSSYVESPDDLQASNTGRFPGFPFVLRLASGAAHVAPPRAGRGAALGSSTFSALYYGPQRAVRLGEALLVHAQKPLEVLFDQAEERGLPRPPGTIQPRTDLHATPTAGGRDRRESRTSPRCAAGTAASDRPGPRQVRPGGAGRCRQQGR